ncbi:MAG: phosphoribosyltransferase [Crocinitomicaceae bacterium]|jgi:ComF family protein|nr:phosphoribosyltransferase [Crocinitomicaceae bacterium]
MQKMTHKWLKNLVEWKNDFLHLVYPPTCLVCEKELSKAETEICFFCREELKFTTFEKYSEESSLDKRFWGRCQLESTFALLYFEQEGPTQQILHQIKYKGKQKLGTEMGRLIGEKMLENQKYDGIDSLVPVPLHPKKQHVRGYNQSEQIANGISEETKIPMNSNFLRRTLHAESQTKMGKFGRWDNISEAFLADKKALADCKHIALVDDVITTGSTLESCINTIRKELPDLKISVISLAVTKT